jgi:hypothetical protein
MSVFCCYPGCEQPTDEEDTLQPSGKSLCKLHSFDYNVLPIEIDRLTVVIAALATAGVVKEVSAWRYDLIRWYLRYRTYLDLQGFDNAKSTK